MRQDDPVKAPLDGALDSLLELMEADEAEEVEAAEFAAAEREAIIGAEEEAERVPLRDLAEPVVCQRFDSDGVRATAGGGGWGATGGGAEERR